MTPEEALAIDEDLQHLHALRENRFFKNHILAEILRRREEHRAAMRDRKLSQAERCEHITAWEDCEALLEFLDREAAKMRAELKEYDASRGSIDRRWSSLPP